VKSLTMLYDNRCGLCSRIAEWLSTARLLVPVTLLPMWEEETARRFPDADGFLREGRFVVIADDGRIYLDTAAKLMILYATADYRGLSYTLSDPLLYPLVDKAVAAVSSARYTISALLPRNECNGRCKR
jgi:predicted DCC family thiol-disulfide oxidoreductase YuxK